MWESRGRDVETADWSLGNPVAALRQSAVSGPKGILKGQKVGSETVWRLREICYVGQRKQGKRGAGNHISGAECERDQEFKSQVVPEPILTPFLRRPQTQGGFFNFVNKGHEMHSAHAQWHFGTLLYSDEY